MNNTVTVTQINFYLKSIIDECSVLKNIFVVGEISNFKFYQRSGHMYFTLKDEKSQLKCVMFSSYAHNLKFMPEDGMRVVCRGTISVYERDGVYQLYAADMQPDGYGALSLAFEKLKEKLEKEGLFDDKYKKPIPRFPNKIGVATSIHGAAVEDIKNITKRRFPLCELVIVPTVVQGDKAPADIVRSIKILDDYDGIDVIIVGRGGGSLEDLWAFNTEEVARAVFACRTPIISAVGHQTDYTICDFAADRRAPTPSAAAELAVPEASEEIKYISTLKERLLSRIKNKIDSEYQRLDSLSGAVSNAEKYYSLCKDKVLNLSDKLQNTFVSMLKDRYARLSASAGRLDALSPLSVLNRGYALVKGRSGVIKSVNGIKVNDKTEILLCDGSAVCTVNEVKPNER